MLKVTIGGTRGAFPATGADFARFGADTTSFLIEGSSGHCLALDAGTGLARFARALARENRRRGCVHIVLSHLHLDHLSGLIALPHFLPDGARVHLHAGRHLEATSRQAVNTLYEPPLWPVTFASMGIQLEHPVFTAGGRPFLRLGSLTLRALAVSHPGGGTAFRFDDDAGGSCVIATDMEWGAMPPANRKAFLRLAASPAPATALLLDAEYDEASYRTRAGWGHGTREQAMEVFRQSGASRLRMIHHAPRLDDSALARADRAVRRVRGAAIARQGQVLRLS